MAAAPPCLTALEREERLEHLFVAFATFGAPRTAIPGLAQADADITMDSTRWVKFFKDLNLLSPPTFSTTDLDLIFNKAKVHFRRQDRKLSYDAFLYALKLASFAKYGGKPASDPSDPLAAIAEQAILENLVSEICATGILAPVVRSAAADSVAPFSAAATAPCDAPRRSKSTHQLHDSSTKLTSTSKSASRANLGGTGSASTRGSRSNLMAATAASAAHATATSTRSRPASRTGSRTNLAAAGSKHELGSVEFTPTVPSIPKGSVFDRLTNPSKYTGTHKERFDPATGKGRGLAGRSQENLGTKPLDKLVHRS
ncbi:hypothetical protein GGF31_006441 [Allomyces arbusculus]|nr:hypothetical protein GGF31_006441 [Allomyces arbusculus]